MQGSLVFCCTGIRKSSVTLLMKQSLHMFAAEHFSFGRWVWCFNPSGVSYLSAHSCDRGRMLAWSLNKWVTCAWRGFCDHQRMLEAQLELDSFVLGQAEMKSLCLSKASSIVNRTAHVHVIRALCAWHSSMRDDKRQSHAHALVLILRWRGEGNFARSIRCVQTWQNRAMAQRVSSIATLQERSRALLLQRTLAVLIQRFTVECLATWKSGLQGSYASSRVAEYVRGAELKLFVWLLLFGARNGRVRIIHNMSCLLLRFSSLMNLSGRRWRLSALHFQVAVLAGIEDEMVSWLTHGMN